MIRGEGEGGSTHALHTHETVAHQPTAVEDGSDHLLVPSIAHSHLWDSNGCEEVSSSISLMISVYPSLSAPQKKTRKQRKTKKKKVTPKTCKAGVCVCVRLACSCHQPRPSLPSPVSDGLWRVRSYCGFSCCRRGHGMAVFSRMPHLLFFLCDAFALGLIGWLCTFADARTPSATARMDKEGGGTDKTQLQYFAHFSVGVVQALGLRLALSLSLFSLVDEGKQAETQSSTGLPSARIIIRNKATQKGRATALA